MAAEIQEPYHIQVQVPSDYAKENSIFSYSNTGGKIIITIVFIFLSIILINIIFASDKENKDGFSSVLSDDINANQDINYNDESYQEEESYTNSQYLKSDDSLADNKNFRLDKSLHDDMTSSGHDGSFTGYRDPITDEEANAAHYDVCTRFKMSF